VNIVTGPAGELVKINAFVFEPGVFSFLRTMAPETDFVLSGFFLDWIKFSM